MYSDYKADFPSVHEVTAEEVVVGRGADGFVLVDVRAPKERAVSMIPGAITPEELEAAPERYAERKIVAYCTIGYRSGLYAAELQEKGFEVFNLAGSILAWTHAGGELVSPDGQPTKRLHVYGRKWDLAAEGYETVW